MSDDYEVGYGKPPKHTRFEPGKSGNPRGRPRGSRGLKTDLITELSARHTIQINGRPVRGNRQQLILRTLATRAAAGDLKAQALILPLIIQALGIEDRGDNRQQLSAADQALLDELLDADPTAATAVPEEAGSAEASKTERAQEGEQNNG